MYKGILEKYREHLPLTDKTPIFTLGEGNTPLVRSRRIEKIIGCQELYFKLENTNPSGSFKDRGMVLAVAKISEAGLDQAICASTGNTSASAASYSAYCGISLTVLLPKGTVTDSKLAQIIAHGARIIQVDANFDKTLELCRIINREHSIPLLNSVNTDRLEGQKTAAFEIVEDLNEAPDFVYLPVGNGGNISAYWKGFNDVYRLGWATFNPRMIGLQAIGADPIVEDRPIDDPETIATAIRIGNPASWKLVRNAINESSGSIWGVSDDQIIEAYNILSRDEGIFCEPASAAAVAGLLTSRNKDVCLEGKKVVCIITGTGLKDVGFATGFIRNDIETSSPDISNLERLLRG